MNTERVLAVVVTYEPGSSLLHNLQAVRTQADQVVVVDNGSSNGADVEAAVTATDCVLIRNASNRGVAAALNQGAQAALAGGFVWLATFDQDSLPPPGLVAALLKMHRGHSQCGRIGLVAASHRDRATDADYHRPGDVLQDGDGWRLVRTAITSGSLVRMKALQQVGPFDEGLFIDCVDHEFCLRLRSHGFLLLEGKDQVLEHSIGNASQHRLLNRQVTCFNHPPVRRYYITRNQLETCRRYMTFDLAQAMGLLWHLVGSSGVVLIFESQRGAKLRAMLAGLRDFMLRRFGRKP